MLLTQIVPASYAPPSAAPPARQAFCPLPHPAAEAHSQPRDSIERIALAPPGPTRNVRGLRYPSRAAMAHIDACVDALNRGIINGQEAQTSGHKAAPTWADLFSSARIAAEHDELWLKRDGHGVIAGYAAVKTGAAHGAELGLVTIGASHRGQGLAKALIGAILVAHPVLQLYVGERNHRAQALYYSFAQQGCDVRQFGTKYYDNGELALGLVIRSVALRPAPATRS